ncbi:glycerol-3-phosphate dehydrogenase [Phreatobacter stygius]|uniref:Glycerol-3-phosphate dehydrogenase n=1 Tax=Phreatobacter stygius TaxID=1940610 RepID=A0A4D7BAU2_9HYPH|nr:glycerol-3-phosphate dehydrogenase [Phreatobacter stygius]QCI67793.1 glycerol-3-phosphate dehydrogenase [Phreatobacter stygius]
MQGQFDLLVIGGGINGCGIARDAVGRGLTVCLVEMDDLASGTSSSSTKLIHGGLRYLEYYEFRLVREALKEREVLWGIAPHVVGPLRFVLPHHAGLRPSWLLRTGLFLYDHLGGRKRLPPTRSLDLTRDPAGLPLKPGLFTRAFEYSDCWVDDSRLVALNARDAADRGAVIRTRTRVVGAERLAEGWQVTVEDVASGARDVVAARMLVNAAGPWVADVLSEKLGMAARAKVRLVQGSHIVVRKLFTDERCYIFQTADGRVVFAIPYEGDFTLIGTTDLDYDGDPAAVAATEAEVNYLCEAASVYFRSAVTPADVVWRYSGVRPLYDDGASEARAATRDYVFELDDASGQPPLLSIFGGKITTYRKLAEDALGKLGIGPGQRGAGWTAHAALPGGDFPVDGRAALAAELRAEFPFLAADHAARLARSYGTRARAILGEARRAEDLGRDFGATLTEAEVRYLADREWARSAGDIVWRRSKLGLRMQPSEIAALDGFMAGLVGAGQSGTLRREAR